MYVAAFEPVVGIRFGRYRSQPVVDGLYSQVWRSCLASDQRHTRATRKSGSHGGGGRGISIMIIFVSFLCCGVDKVRVLRFFFVLGGGGGGLSTITSRQVVMPRAGVGGLKICRVGLWNVSRRLPTSRGGSCQVLRGGCFYGDGRGSTYYPRSHRSVPGKSLRYFIHAK